MGRKLTTAEATRLWELYQGGHSQHVIAAELDLQLRTVRRYLSQRRKLERLADQDGRLLVAEAKLREHLHWPAVTVSQVSGIPVPLVEAIRARLVAAGELTADGDWFADAAARGPKNAAEERKMAAEIERRKARLRELRDGPSVEICG